MLDIDDTMINNKIKQYNQSPHNLHLLYDLIKLLRECGKYKLAYQYAQFFMKQNTRKWKEEILYELSLICWYVNQTDEGYKVSEKLLFNRKISPTIKNNVYQNLIHYIKPIAFHQTKKLTFPLPPIDEKRSETWQPLNPSIIKTMHGYVVNCRLVNYKKIGDNFTYLSEDKILRSRNIILTLDKHLNLLHQSELFDTTNRLRFPTSIVGPEDCRIISWNDDIVFSCTILDTNPYQIPQIGLGKLPLISPLPKDLYISDLHHLKGFDNHSEKNWLPFIINNSLNIIYSFDPLTILTPNLNTGECSITHNHSNKYDYSRFRGGAPPISFDDGYLLVIHEVINNSIHYYYNRFVWLDKKYRIKKISPLFTLFNKQIEYCSGLCYSHEPNKLIMSLGVNDQEAWICIFEIDMIRKLLSSVS